MRSLVTILCICLTGCSVFNSPRPVPKWDEVNIRIKLTEDLPPRMNGRARVNKDSCYIELRKSIFPTCLPHEVLHCFGWTHDSSPNMEFCRVE